MRAAIYTRISEDDTEGDARGQGVKRQEQDARAEAERRGWDVVNVYPDNDVSATRTKRRPHYERMVRDIRAGLVDAVIVWDIDRLTRTPREIEDFIELADATNLTLVNVTGMGDLGSDDGRMMLRIKGALARREVEQMRKRLKRKYLANAEEGKPHGRAPYGMIREWVKDSRGKVVDFWDVPDPATAPVLREIAGRVLGKPPESLRSIAMSLTAAGVPGPGGGAWNSTIIRQAMVRPSYAGIRVHQGKAMGPTRAVALGKDTVFDEDTHDQLVALLTDPSRRANYRGREPLYLLSGIATCGRCGGRMRSQVGHKATSKRTGAVKRQPPAYVCSACFKVRRQRGPVDELVEAKVLACLDDPRVFDSLFAKGDEDAAREAHEQIASVDAKLARNIDMLDADEMTPDQYKRSNARLREDRAAAEARLRAVTRSDSLARFTELDLTKVWDVATVVERREVIAALFDVTIDPQGPGRRFDPDLIRVELKAS